MTQGSERRCEFHGDALVSRLVAEDSYEEFCPTCEGAAGARCVTYPLKRLDPAGRCPLCETPWYAASSLRCDHEADWYRSWLSER